MPIVDTHCHVSLVYYEPVEVLLFQMDRAGVDHAVLIQMREEYDNEYQFECVHRYPGRFASVVLVDHNRPDAPAQPGPVGGVEQAVPDLPVAPVAPAVVPGVPA